MCNQYVASFNGEISEKFERNNQNHGKMMIFWKPLVLLKPVLHHCLKLTRGMHEILEIMQSQITKLQKSKFLNLVVKKLGTG